LDPQARRVRIMAAPAFGRDLPYANTLAQGYDPAGRMIFGGAPPPRGVRTNIPGSPPEVLTIRRDSGRVFRYDPDSRQQDTLGVLERPMFKYVYFYKDGQLVGGGPYLNPLPETDEWALLPDGTVAIVRAHDYHIDWISPDGTQSSTPKMPFAWR